MLAARSDFNASSTAGDVVASHDLRGRFSVVTGASNGIGKESARALASAGATVIMGVRDKARGDTIAKEITEATGNANVHAVQLDLSKLKSVRSFSHTIGENVPKIDILINNAGIADVPFTTSEDGFELHFATNHLGHFVLFQGLLDRLRSANGARVVSLSSAAHRKSAINFEDIHFRHTIYDAYVAYAQSKTATSLFSIGVSRRHADDGIFSNAVMPGMIATGLIGEHTPERLRAMRFTDEHGNLQPYVKSLEQGAATSVWAAVAPELEGVGGLYLEDCGVAPPWSRELMARHPWAGFVPHAVSTEDAERLWIESESMVA